MKTIARLLAFLSVAPSSLLYVRIRAPISPLRGSLWILRLLAEAVTPFIANPFTDESAVAMQKALRYSRASNTIAVFALIGLVLMAYLRWARPYQLR